MIVPPLASNLFSTDNITRPKPSVEETFDSKHAKGASGQIETHFWSQRKAGLESPTKFQGAIHSTDQRVQQQPAPAGTTMMRDDQSSQ